MMQNLSIVFLVLGMIQLTMAYPYQNRFKSLTPTVDCAKYPAPLSYHVHVTYMLTNDQQIQDVQDFRDVAQKYFAPFLGENPICQGTEVEPSGRYDNGRLCMIYDHNLTNDTLGPFAVGEWSMFVPVHYYNAVVPWFVQHRGQFNLLVHPNTGCEYEDHSAWAQWSGAPWNMDMSIFTVGTQTNEFGEYLGMPHNPTCLSNKGEVCGFVDQKTLAYSPQVVCCSGMSCNCDPRDTQCFCK